MRHSICFSTYMVECGSTQEMRNLSNNSENIRSIGGVDIAILGYMHYYVVNEGADVESAMSWMKKNIKDMLYDPLMDHPYQDWIHSYTNSELVQIVLRDSANTFMPNLCA